jgi:uncharacterized protein (TIGR03435 family)
MFSVGVIVICGVVIPSFSQSWRMSAQNGPRRVFDVATVKVSAEPFLQTTPNRTEGRIVWTTDLWYVIGYAYRLQPFRISGPIPGSSSIYTVEATFDRAASDDDVRAMFQAVLVDRFRMTSHVVTKDVDGYALSVSPGGIKIREVRADEKPAPLPEWLRPGTSSIDDFEGSIFTTLPQPGVYALTARRVTLLQFCEELQRQLGIPVLDRTNLPGNYYFAFRYATETGDVALPALSTAIQEELGLRLTRQRGPVDMLVVDHIERVPTPN